MPCFVYYLFWQDVITWFIVAEGLLTACMIILGGLAIAKAFSKGGRGGAIQSIDSLKVIIPLTLWAIITQSLPTLLQSIGVVLSVVACWLVGIYDKS